MTHPGGRYPSVTPEKTAIIVAGIKSNLPYKFCAWDAGITERTIYHWLEKGERDADDGLITCYTEFFHAIKKAEAEKVKDLTESLDNCTERWQARAWLLERRWRKDFSAQTQDADKDKTINTLLEMFQAEQKKHE